MRPKVNPLLFNLSAITSLTKSRILHLAVAAEYYGQRASYPGTLIITEATFVSAKAGSYTNAPGCYTEEQIQGWKKVVETVHSKKSYIFLQQWSLGRAADGELLRKETGEAVHSASDIGIEGREKPRAMTVDEIKVSSTSTILHLKSVLLTLQKCAGVSQLLCRVCEEFCRKMRWRRSRE